MFANKYKTWEGSALADFAAANGEPLEHYPDSVGAGNEVLVYQIYKGCKVFLHVDSNRVISHVETSKR